MHVKNLNVLTLTIVFKTILEKRVVFLHLLDPCQPNSYFEVHFKRGDSLSGAVIYLYRATGRIAVSGSEKRYIILWKISNATL